VLPRKKTQKGLVLMSGMYLRGRVCGRVKQAVGERETGRCYVLQLIAVVCVWPITEKTLHDVARVPTTSYFLKYGRPHFVT